MNNFYMQCRLWRLTHFLTCTEMGEMLGVSAVAISRFERGMMTSEELGKKYAALMLEEGAKNGSEEE